MSSIDFNTFCRTVSALTVFDPSGRGGSMFIKCLFDRHPQILAVPWLHYTYSYLITAFGTEPVLSAQKAHTFMTRTAYFRLMYQEVSDDHASLITRFGGDPQTPIDRNLVRKTFDDLILGKDTVSRKELILAAQYASARGLGYDLSQVRWIYINDAISLRSENLFTGFSGRVVDLMVSDFPKAKMINLVRDPRATYASSCHQFINRNDNMYGLSPVNFLWRWLCLLFLRPSTEGCTYLYWSLYLMATSRTMQTKMKQYQGRFYTLKNEAVNTDFLNTVTDLARWISIDPHNAWQDPDYAPTICGAPWKGTGAYNSRYQLFKQGPLKNDPDTVARTVTGPNVYVTQRWKKRLPDHEIALLEHLFADELLHYQYPLHVHQRQKPNVIYFLACLCKPFSGEWPGWAFIGKAHVPQRLLYVLLWLPFAVVARLWVLLLYLFTDLYKLPKD